MRTRQDLLQIALFAVAVAVLALTARSGVVLNFTMMALYACLMAQSWNLLGGYGGQFSFGHALFFGTGAYAQAIAQLQGHLNPWLALPLAIAAAALVGVMVGALSFRYGLKGSYFALVTLGLSIVLENLALLAFKSDTRSIDTPYTLATVAIGPAMIAVPKLVAFGGAQPGVLACCGRR